MISKGMNQFPSAANENFFVQKIADCAEDVLTLDWKKSGKTQQSKKREEEQQNFTLNNKK